MQELELAGRTALVTGAASGIGRATVLKLVGAGCRVAALDRDEAGLARLVGETGETGEDGEAGSVPIGVDLADPASTRGAVRAAIDRLGSMDIVVNNAGIGFRADALETTLEQWDLTFAVNVRAPLIVCQEVIPHMLERGAGVIVNVASVAGLVGISARTAYGASKAALISLTQNLTVDFAARGIRVNCVAPGTIETPWVDRIVAGAADPGALRRQMGERQVVGRLGTAEEVADTILFLASPRASFFHGSVVVVDGGLTAR